MWGKYYPGRGILKSGVNLYTQKISASMEKIDPYNSLEKLERWKEQKINSLSVTNLKYLREYIADMENGVNVASSHKGVRSPVRLISLASRMKKIMELAQEKYGLKDITKITSDRLHSIFTEMQTGKIKKANGKSYEDVGDYVKRFKSFWHWHQKVNKRLGKEIPDITEDLSVERKKKPKFVYFTKEKLEEMLEAADYETRIFMLLLFDTGIRCPTEAMNLRVSDFVNDYKELSIRDEISKTFGRQIKLMMCSEAIRKYIEDNHLSGNDLLFVFNPATINKRLKKIGEKVLGKGNTLGKLPGNDMTMYDFRHSSACYWLPRYKSRNAILYRFGWKKEEEIHYYTELLGMKDTITEEDMLLATTRTPLEKQVIDLTKKIKAYEEDANKNADLIVKILNNLYDLEKKINAKHQPQSK